MKRFIAAACAAAFVFAGGCSAYDMSGSSCLTDTELPDKAEEKGYVPLNYRKQVGRRRTALA